MPVQCWLIICPSAGPALCICLVFAGISFRVTCLYKPLSRWWTVSGLMLFTQRTHRDSDRCRCWCWAGVYDAGPTLSNNTIQTGSGGGPILEQSWTASLMLEQLCPSAGPTFVFAVCRMYWAGAGSLFSSTEQAPTQCFLSAGTGHLCGIGAASAQRLRRWSGVV